MDEYRVEYCVATKDNNIIPLEKIDAKWSKEIEEKALSFFYNGKAYIKSN